ncbi:MAG: hypothetical protein V4621_05500 [Pseudomonadota bacterium]
MDGDASNTQKATEKLLAAPFGQAANFLSKDIDDTTLKDFILSRTACVHWNLNNTAIQEKLSINAVSQHAYDVLHDWTQALTEAWRRSPKPGSVLHTLLTPSFITYLDDQLDADIATYDTPTFGPHTLNGWVADHTPPSSDNRDLTQKVSDECLYNIVGVHGQLDPRLNLATVSDHALAWATIQKVDEAFHGPFDSETYAIAFATGRHVAMKSMNSLRDFQTLLHELAHRGKPSPDSPLMRIWASIMEVPEEKRNDITALARHVFLLAPLKPQDSLTADEARAWIQSQCPTFR